MCSLMINGVAHGPDAHTTTCQLHMRHFKDRDEVFIEPWRAKAFPVIRDLCVDRSAFDRIIQAGGFVSVNSGGAQDANCIPVPKTEADLAMDAAQCIGCGACVAACRNASAMLFVSAKISRISDSFLRVSQNGSRGRWVWSRKWTKRDLATAPTSSSARRFALKTSVSILLRG